MGVEENRKRGGLDVIESVIKIMWEIGLSGSRELVWLILNSWKI